MNNRLIHVLTISNGPLPYTYIDKDIGSYLILNLYSVIKYTKHT